MRGRVSGRIAHLQRDILRAHFQFAQRACQGQRIAAETALRRAVQLRPGWGEAHYSLAMVYATQQPPFKELAQWHYQKAITGGYPRNVEFEKMIEEKRVSSQ